MLDGVGTQHHIMLVITSSYVITWLIQTDYDVEGKLFIVSSACCVQNSEDNNNNSIFLYSALERFIGKFYMWLILYMTDIIKSYAKLPFIWNPFSCPVFYYCS